MDLAWGSALACQGRRRGGGWQGEAEAGLAGYGSNWQWVPVLVAPSRRRTSGGKLAVEQVADLDAPRASHVPHDRPRFSFRPLTASTASSLLFTRQMQVLPGRNAACRKRGKGIPKTQPRLEIQPPALERNMRSL